MRIDAHHHLWDLAAVHYPWLMDKNTTRFFGDPAPIARDYLLPEFTSDAKKCGFTASVHIQVGAEDGVAEAKWVDEIAGQSDWQMKQVAFCDLAANDRSATLDILCALPSVVGVRQIIGRAPGEDAATGTQKLIASEAFLQGLQDIADRGLSFDLQLLPELMEPMAALLAQVPHLPVALCHAGSPYDRTTTGIDKWATSLTALSSLPQVTAKLSGLGMFAHGWVADDFAPIVNEVIAQFGPSRVMFGSNFPVCSLTSDYDGLKQAYDHLIPQQMQDQIYGHTAAAFYRF
ncbi:MAG: amidohydrolase family protein [Candidatus Puniceispirillaceae bacterium]